MPRIEQVYIDAGKVRYIYRPMVWDMEDQSSRLAAEALYCAGDQGKFWEMHDWLYFNADRWSAAEDVIAVLAGETASALGLDGTKLDSCLRQEQYRSRVEGFVKDAQNRGITSTPTFLVNDQQLVGAQSFETFQQAIEGTTPGSQPINVGIAVGAPALGLLLLILLGFLLTPGVGPMVPPRTFRLRMVIAALALVGLLVALYLALYEVDLSNSLVCPNTGCETVNRSQYVNMFVIPIGVIGVIGYAMILAVSLGRMNRRNVAGLPIGPLLVGLGGFGFFFSLFLTYLELFQIGAICTWCTVSAVLMTGIFVLAIMAWLAERAPAKLRRS